MCVSRDQIPADVLKCELERSQSNCRKWEESLKTTTPDSKPSKINNLNDFLENGIRNCHTEYCSGKNRISSTLSCPVDFFKGGAKELAETVKSFNEIAKVHPAYLVRNCVSSETCRQAFSKSVKTLIQEIKAPKQIAKKVEPKALVSFTDMEFSEGGRNSNVDETFGQFDSLFIAGEEFLGLDEKTRSCISENKIFEIRCIAAGVITVNIANPGRPLRISQKSLENLSNSFRRTRGSKISDKTANKLISLYNEQSAAYNKAVLDLHLELERRHPSIPKYKDLPENAPERSIALDLRNQELKKAMEIEKQDPSSPVGELSRKLSEESKKMEFVAQKVGLAEYQELIASSQSKFEFLQRGNGRMIDESIKVSDSNRIIVTNPDGTKVIGSKHTDAFSPNLPAARIKLKEKMEFCRSWNPPVGKSCFDSSPNLRAWYLPCTDRKHFTRKEIKTYTAAPTTSSMECISRVEFPPNSEFAGGIAGPMRNSGSEDIGIGINSTFADSGLHGGTTQLMYLGESRTINGIEKRLGARELESNELVKVVATSYIANSPTGARISELIRDYRKTKDPYLLHNAKMYIEGIRTGTDELAKKEIQNLNRFLDHAIEEATVLNPGIKSTLSRLKNQTGLHASGRRSPTDGFINLFPDVPCNINAADPLSAPASDNFQKGQRSK